MALNPTGDEIYLTDDLLVDIIGSEYKNARTDPDTGLHNRRAFIERIGEMKLSRHPLAVMILDIDGLKEVNDTRGHTVGDELIKTVANIIKSKTRGGDFVARIGGDEFAVILDTDPDKLNEAGTSLTTRVLEAIKQHNQQHSDMPISVSIGSAVSPYIQGKEHPIEDLITAADEKMYAMKREHHSQNQRET